MFLSSRGSEQSQFLCFRRLEDEAALTEQRESRQFHTQIIS